MKKMLFSLTALVIGVAAFSQQAATTTAATSSKKADELVKFKETKHEFGKIKQGVPVTFDFSFNNISNQVVVIESATASCGCTTPVKPETPIAPGKTSKVTAGFNAAAPGPFDKTIYVKVQCAELPLELKITGEVLKAEDFAKYEAEKGKGKSGK